MAVVDDIIIVHMQRPGVDGAGISPAEKAQLVNDVAAALARVNVTKLTDVPDVSASGLAAGKALIWDGTKWKPGEQVGSIGAVYDHTNTKVVTDATSITAKKGLTARVGSGANAVVLEARLGASGTSEVLTREDHTHTLRADVPLRFDASGALSSGSRTLASGTVSGLDSSTTYVLTAHLSGDLRGGGTGAGYTMPSVTIGGNTRQRFGEVRTVSGVDRDYDMKHPGQTVSGVTSVTVSAAIAYRSGDPITVGAGELVITIKANR